MTYIEQKLAGKEASSATMRYPTNHKFITDAKNGHKSRDKNKNKTNQKKMTETLVN